MSSSPRPAHTGFPVQQLIILALCRICEPISFTSIFPYIYQMIESFGVTKNENEIGIYAGMVTSSFAIAEFSTGMLWGRISDRIGRKPVLIIGLVGTLISMLIFGFAKSLSVALIARALGGGLNGNIGVIQTAVAELVREKEHQPRAFAIMPFIWCLGSIIGPALGGLLAQPTKFYPGVFPKEGLLDEYPFLLPNMVSSVVLVLGIANGILFLDETHDMLRNKRDYGRELGDKLVNVFRWRKVEESEAQPLLAKSTTTYNRTSSSGESVNDSINTKPKRIPSVSRAFTRPVIGLVLSYGILAYHTMGFEQLMPVFLSTPVPTEKPNNFFLFTGGLGMTTQRIGFILSMQGLFSMCTQFFVFPPVARAFGVLNVYRFCMFTYGISYVVVPYLVWLPEGNIQTAGVYIVLAVKIMYGVLAYPCNAILITNSAPSLLVLGAINGIASSCASLARAFAPTVTGVVYSYGLNINCVGLAWWANALVCLIGAIQAISMRQEILDRPAEDLDDLVSLMDEEHAVGHNTNVESHIPGIDANTQIIGTADETFDEYGLVRSVIEADMDLLSASLPPDTTLASLARLDVRISERAN